MKSLARRWWWSGTIWKNAIARQWAELFRQWDVVLAPVIATPAFPHDHSTDRRARRLQIDGADHIYDDQVVWASLATLTGLPAAVAPIGRSDAGLPIGVQIIGPFLEDRTPVHVAGLIERELGGFVPPPAFPA